LLSCFAKKIIIEPRIIALLSQNRGEISPVISRRKAGARALRVLAAVTSYCNLSQEKGKQPDPFSFLSVHGVQQLLQ
jgi:hypothetical protein